MYSHGSNLQLDALLHASQQVLHRVLDLQHQVNNPRVTADVLKEAVDEGVIRVVAHLDRGALQARTTLPPHKMFRSATKLVLYF